MARLPFDKASLAELPEEPGVYVFLDEGSRPLYVGKAKDLRDRVRAYFGVGDARLVSRLLSESARWIEFLVTGSVKEALILENSLIKKHKPRLNIRLKDDKTYFSLRLDPQQEWPRLTIVRRRRPDDVLYFGPYPSASACRRTLQYLNGLFPLRTCRDSVLYNRSRPCLAYEIGRCVAPCVGYVERTAYLEIVDRVVRFLSGGDREILDELERDMLRAAEALDFERAAELRDRLRHMRETLESPRVARRGGPDRDVVGLALGEGDAHITVLHVRDGQLGASSDFRVRRFGDPDEILASFLGQFYGPDQIPPEEILLPEECADLDLHREILEEKRGAGVELRVPERGEGKRLCRLADKNASFGLLRGRKKLDDRSQAARVLQESLGLVHRPRRIECFDVSHLGGEQVVGSRVSFKDGEPDKAGYRHYRLREVQRNDDFAAMEEILRRRLRRGLDEGDLPELIVIDGGRAQLGRVVQVLKELRIDAVDVIGLAKAREGEGRSTLAAHERIYLPEQDVPIVLAKDAPETLLLQRIRDEAHRFAITYNRRLRGKERIRTVLELVPGIGPRRARALLARFGSVKEVRAASTDELLGVPGMTRALAEGLAAWFDLHGRDGTGAGDEG